MRTLARQDRIEKSLEALAGDRRSGASELALRVLRLLEQAGPVRDAPVRAYQRDVRALARRIGRARPGMAPVAAAADKFMKMFVALGASGACDSREAYRMVRHAVGTLERALLDATPAVAERFASRFARVRRPLLISYSSQVVAAVKALPSRSQRVVVCESRPGLEGRRTARLLAGRARSVTVITEAQIGAAVEDCDCAILGSDTIYQDGSVSNKSGSYLLALACERRSRPVIVVGDRFKMGGVAMSGNRAGGSRVRGKATVARRGTGVWGGGEAHGADEVWKHAPRGIRVRNEYFERVPRELIDYLVLEDGVYRPAQVRAVWRKERRTRG